MTITEIISYTVAGISLTRLIVGYINEKVFSTKVFQERKSAEHRMIKDMVRSSQLNFSGITHNQMTRYLDAAFNVGKELHWETINFFFPAPEYGVCWNDDFGSIMNINILKISSFLMNRADELKDLKQINFYMNTCGCNVSGSFFRYRNSKHNYNVIYDVMQTLSLDKKQENAKTIRLNHRNHKQFFQRLEDMFYEIKSGARLLYSIDANEKDLWNKSVFSWETYEQHSLSPHTQSMCFMLNQINMPECSSVLSLGAGTGKMEMQLITSRGYTGFLGLADKSYTMLYNAYRRLKDEKNVSYALIDLSRSEWTLYGALAGRKYDYILMHFSLHNFISAEQDLGDFARRLKRILAYNGKIVVAIHDHVYAPYDENELLRGIIKRFGERYGIGRPDKSKTVSLYDLKYEFFLSGLPAIRETELIAERSISERVAMWKVDAILDSILDVGKLNERGLREELYKELDAIEDAKTQPMTVKYIAFSEVIQVVSALIVNDAGEFLTVVKNKAYLLPGGEILFGEDEKDTLSRELYEELGVGPQSADIGDKIGSFAFERAYLENKPLHMHVYRCTLKKARLTPNCEISDYEWIDLKKLTTYDNMPKEYFLKILESAGILLR